jgi:hypothetical protein
MVPEEAGIAWNTWLFPIKDKDDNEIRIKQGYINLTNCSYGVLFAAIE